MMPSFFLTLLLFLLLLLPAFPRISAQPKAKEQIQRELEAIISARCTAIRNHDAQKELAFLTADYSYKLPNGKIVTRQEVEKLGAIEQESRVILEFSQTISKLSLAGSEAVIEVTIHQLVKQKMRDDRDALVTNEWVERQTWSNQIDGWKLRLAEWQKHKKSAIKGVTAKEYRTVLPMPPTKIQPNPEDTSTLQAGNALVFIYRLEDHALPKTSIYCNNTEIAGLTRGSFIKVKLLPGIYQFRSEKEPSLELSVSSGGVYFLEAKLEPGFPAAKGRLSKDEDSVGAQCYKLPKTFGLKPLNPKHVKDPARIILN